MNREIHVRFGESVAVKSAALLDTSRKNRSEVRHDQGKDRYAVKLMCRLLSVSPSGYYDWRYRPLSSLSEANAVLAAKIKNIFDEEHSRAGAKRIAKRLMHEGTPVSRHRVARIMRLHGWRAKAARKFKATTNSNHKLPVAPNLLQQNFSASRPNEKWVSDISVPQQAA